MTSFFLTCQRHRIPGTKADKGACAGAPGRAKTAELAVWPRRVNSVLESLALHVHLSGPGSSDCRLLLPLCSRPRISSRNASCLAPPATPGPSLGFMPGLARAVFPRPFPMPGVIMPSTAPATSPKAGFASPSCQPYCWYCHRCHVALFPSFLSHPVCLMTGFQIPISLTIVAVLAGLPTLHYLSTLHLHSASWAKERGLASLEVRSLHRSMFLCQNWNSYWLRWIAHVKEAYYCDARAKPEMVLVGELLAQIRHRNVDIDDAAINLAVQNQGSQAKNIRLRLLLSILLLSSKSAFQCKLMPSHMTEFGSLSISLVNCNISFSRKNSRQPTSTIAFVLQPDEHGTLPQPPQPDSVMKPPPEGSTWLVNNLPAKFQDKELRSWISNLAINDRKKAELDAWITDVEHYVSTLDDEDKTLTSKMRRIGVVCGVPVSVISILQKTALARIMAVASYMER